MAFSDKKKQFADALRSGMNQTDAAKAAGYAEKHAGRQGYRLSKDPDVMAYIGRMTKKVDPQIQPATEQKTQTFEKIDPLDYMEYVIKDELADPKLRLDAAKALAVYRHPRIESAGKKEDKKKKAEDVAAGRFGAGTAPGQLKVVK